RLNPLRVLLTGALSLMLLSQHPAIAEQGIDVVNHRETLLGQGSDPRTNPGTAIKDCWNQAGPMATHQWIQYGSFTNGTGTYPLWMDEYTPTSPGSHAAIVSAHGGSWVGGCRSWNDGLSARLAQKGFIVFNIDYRLACAALSPVYLCGYHYPTPIGDVGTAIAYV